MLLANTVFLILMHAHKDGHTLCKCTWTCLMYSPANGFTLFYRFTYCSNTPRNAALCLEKAEKKKANSK